MVEIPVGEFLFKTQQPFYKVLVCGADLAFFRHQPLSFSGFFGENVSFECFLKRDFTGASDFESFFGTRICFNLWHLLMRFCMTPCWRIRTGGSLLEPFGQFPHGRDHLKMEREGMLIFRKIEIKY